MPAPLRFLLCLFLAVAPSCSPSTPREPAEQVFTKSRDSVVKIYSLSENPAENRSGTGFAARLLGGKIVTNRHVVEKASVVVVETSEGVWSAPSWKENPELDVALLPIPSNEHMPLLDLKSASELSPGLRVFTVGYPLGDLLAVHEGSVSSIDGKELVFSAPLSSGASGSPLLDADSNVVGLCHSFVPDAQNYNLALPSDFILMDCQWIERRSSPDPQLARYLGEIVRAKSMTRRSLREWESIASEYPDWRKWVRKTMLTRRPMMRNLEDTSLAIHSVDWSVAGTPSSSREDLLSAVMMQKNATALMEAWSLHLKNMAASSGLRPSGMPWEMVSDMSLVPAMANAAQKIASSLSPASAPAPEKAEDSPFTIDVSSSKKSGSPHAVQSAPSSAVSLASALQEYLELESQWEKACLP